MAASEKDLHAEALEAYEEAYSAQSAEENRQTYIDSNRFWRIGGVEQWPEAIRKERTTPGKERPMLTVNKGPSFAKQVINDIRQNRPAIKVRPVDSAADIQTALVMQGLIKNIEQSSNAAVAYDTAAECAVYGGFGYFAIDYDYACDDNFDMDILFRRIANPLCIVGDPYSTAVDSSDWNFAFETEVMSEDQFKRDYPDAEPISFDSNDSEVRRLWTSGHDIVVASYWKREEVEKTILLMSNGQVVDAKQYTGMTKAAFDLQGITVARSRQIRSHKVKKCVMNGQEILVKRKVMADGKENEVGYHDWPGRYIPIIPVYGEELNVEGKRLFRSMLHDAMDPQRQLNYWETTATELVALSPRVPFIGEEGSFTDPNWATANTENHAYLYYKKGAQKPERQTVDSGPAIGAMTQAKQASDNMKAVLSMYDASLGNRSNETSGVAIERRQREGDTAQFHFYDNLTRAIRWGAIVVADLIPHVYTQGRIARVLGDDGQAQNVQLGPREYPPQAEQKPGQQPAPPRIGALQGVFDVGMGKYDIVVEAGPSYTTQRQETADVVKNLMSADPRMIEIGGDILVKNLDIKDGDELARRLSKMLPPQLQDNGEPQIPPQVQQMIEQGKEMIAMLTEENQKLKQDEVGKIATIQKAEADKQHYAVEADKTALARERLPIEEMQAQAQLVNAQKELEVTRAQLGATVAETATTQATGNAATVIAEAATALSLAASQIAAVVPLLTAPKQKRVEMQRNPQGGYSANVIEVPTVQ